MLRFFLEGRKIWFCGLSKVFDLRPSMVAVMCHWLCMVVPPPEKVSPASVSSVAASTVAAPNVTCAFHFTSVTKKL